MSSHIRVSERSRDENLLQLQFEVYDGSSTFINSAYADLDWFGTAADELHRFARQIYGGLYDLDVGMSGPEYADGAIAVRFHWFRPTELYVATWQQSSFFEFKGNQVASEASLFLRTQPALLDRFIAELRSAHRQQQEEATLDCIPLSGV
jgi:hypothetical protein